ncbi:MAG: tRNA 4-thiouridine(8) synthase ThiI [Oscillospiraceae bacterium]|nr:tRNA 4-thiouridine(8) synthase ThiI [Oscillospiraceae bacterium]
MEIILAKYGEIALKGLNKRKFEDKLVQNTRAALPTPERFVLNYNQSTLYVRPKDEEADVAAAYAAIKRVFGISAVQRCLLLPKDMQVICDFAPDYLRDCLINARTFKVEARRADKRFPLNSPQIQTELGDTLVTAFPHLKADMTHPEVTIRAEIRESAAYLSAAREKGAGGIPVGSSGQALLLLSGGFDSPVAAYLSAKRGLTIEALHFQSPPYTSERALEKVKSLCAALTPYCGHITLHAVLLTKLQETLRDNAPSELFTVLLRRQMLFIANDVCKAGKSRALVTGECVGQVASQTLGAIQCTDDAAAYPVFRPVIGFDKIEITNLARQIGTFGISELPYEDCCTIFTPKHPKTNPHLDEVLAAEQRFDYAPLRKEAYDGIQRFDF